MLAETSATFVVICSKAYRALHAIPESEVPINFPHLKSHKQVKVRILYRPSLGISLASLWLLETRSCLRNFFFQRFGVNAIKDRGKTNSGSTSDEYNTPFFKHKASAAKDESLRLGGLFSKVSSHFHTALCLIFIPFKNISRRPPLYAWVGN